MSQRKGKKAADPPGFEPGSEAPEAPILSRLYYESSLTFQHDLDVHILGDLDAHELP